MHSPADAGRAHLSVLHGAHSQLWQLKDLAGLGYDVIA
jgi:hypothetical protein